MSSKIDLINVSSDVAALTYQGSMTLRTFNISPNVPPIYSKFNQNLTTNFTALDDVAVVADPILVTSNGSIRWSGMVDSSGEDYNTHINIGEGCVGVNTSALDNSINDTAVIS